MSDHAHDKFVESGTGRKTLGVYLVGFILCLIVTIAAFVIVGQRMFSPHMMMISVSILAIVQLFIQVKCFLRLNMSQDGMWNTMSFIFALLIVAVVVGGSLWIMANLNYYMMH